MNERAFAEGRREDWNRLRELLEGLERRRLGGRGEVQELLRRYRRAASDLAEADTNFPGSAAAEELHMLVGRAYGAIYRQPEERLGVSGFVLRKLPCTFRKNVGYFLFALATFVCACVTGIAVCSADERWTEFFLPPAAIEALERGELWTEVVFSVIPSPAISALVFYNNAFVCFTAFALGLSLGVGTLYVLFVNGLMLGTAIWLCWKHAMLDQLAQFVVGHGVLEISAIMMAGAAGLMLGDALARPGRYRRLDALRVRARDAAALAVGAIPFLALAGFVEGFLSPAHFPAPAKYAVGLGTGCLLYLYLFLCGRGERAS